MPAFHVDIDSGTAVVTLDVTGAPVNTLSSAVAQEFDGLLTRLEGDPMVGAIVLISGKADNFIAGADIEEFTRLRTAEEATALSRRAQDLMNRVAACRKPVIAAIHGSCLGGGLELALACHWRVATDHPKTQLGLPETQIGLLPGAADDLANGQNILFCATGISDSALLQHQKITPRFCNAATMNGAPIPVSVGSANTLRFDAALVLGSITFQ